MPYLLCDSAYSTVGPQDVEIACAGQTIRFEEDERRIVMECGDSSYGQEAGAVLESEVNCIEQCSSEQEACMVLDASWSFAANHTCAKLAPCAPVSTLAGETFNCTVITGQDEHCVDLPAGALLDVLEEDQARRFEPYSESGYYRLDKSHDGDIPCASPHSHRDQFCYEFRPCSPEKACDGNNQCSKGYTQTMCSLCCTYAEGHLDDGSKNPECWDPSSGEQWLYFRTNGECVVCPQNLWLLVCLFLSAIFIGGSVAYTLKKKRVDVAVVAIGVDYLQVLSVFATTEVEWPAALQAIYSAMAIFSFDLFDIFPPECSLDVGYETSWMAIQFAPIGFVMVCYGCYSAYYFYLNYRFAHNKKKFAKTLTRLRGMLLSTLLYAFYFIYLFICENTLDVLSCAKIRSEDGATETEAEYLTSDPNYVCWEEGSMQMRLVPLASIFVVVYIVGYPLIIGVMLLPWNTRRLIMDDQLLRVQSKGYWEEKLPPYLEQLALTRAKLGMLYYRFTPELPYWILIVVLKKCCMAWITLVFRQSASFQLSMLLMVLFSSLVLQVRNMPYLSPARRDEMLDTYSERVAKLDEEVKRSTKNSDKTLAAKRTGARRRALTDIVHAKTPAQFRDATVQLVFEYNTVESFLLSCSILVCLFGVMLDADYVADGRNAYTRDCITYTCIFVIMFSFFYFAAVVWQEVVTAIFPGLHLDCLGMCADSAVKKDDDDDYVDESGIEMAEGNPAMWAAQRATKDTESSLYTVEEQVQMKELVQALQKENKKLKKDLGEAQTSSSKAQARVVKKKKKIDDASEDIDIADVTTRRGSKVETSVNPLARGRKK